MQFDILKYLEEEEKKEIERQEELAYNWEQSLYDPNEDAGDRV